MTGSIEVTTNRHELRGSHRLQYGEICLPADAGEGYILVFFRMGGLVVPQDINEACVLGIKNPELLAQAVFD